MVRDAENYRQEDDQQRDRVTAKNALESYAFNMKSTVEDEKMKDKIPDEDKQSILSKCNEVIQWLDQNQVNSIQTKNAKIKILEPAKCVDFQCKESRFINLQQFLVAMIIPKHSRFYRKLKEVLSYSFKIRNFTKSIIFNIVFLLNHWFFITDC